MLNRHLKYLLPAGALLGVSSLVGTDLSAETSYQPSWVSANSNNVLEAGQKSSGDPRYLCLVEKVESADGSTIVFGFANSLTGNCRAREPDSSQLKQDSGGFKMLHADPNWQYSWTTVSNGDIPDDALVYDGPISPRDTLRHVCQVEGTSGGVSVGWVDTGEGVCHTYGNFTNNTYEVLTVTQPGDEFGPYCDDGQSGTCGRAGERTCDTTSGCGECYTGYDEDDGTCSKVEDLTASSQADWMAEDYEYIKDIPLNELVIPGTHDSGTSEMSSVSQTQYLDIGDQLEKGIRYFDLRVGQDASDHLKIHHGGDMGGAPLMETVLLEVATFTREHPGEIIILKFSHFFEERVPLLGPVESLIGVGGQFEDTEKKEFRNQMLFILAPKLFESLQNGQSNTVPYPTDSLVDHSILTPESTVADIIDGRSVGAIIVDIEEGYDDDANDNTYFRDHTVSNWFWTNRMCGSYSQDRGRDDMLLYFQRRLQDFEKGHAAGSKCYGEENSDNWSSSTRSTVVGAAEHQESPAFYVLQTEVKASFGDGGGHDPEHYHPSHNPVIQRNIFQNWGQNSSKHVNIVQADFFDKSCLVPMARAMNKGVAADEIIDGCYSVWPAVSSGDEWDAHIWK